MDRYRPRYGTGFFAHDHMEFIQDSTQKALASAFEDYLAISDCFVVQGFQVTETPAGTGISYSTTAGVLCIRGEFLPVAAQTVMKSAAQVVFIVIQEVGIDVAPAWNIDGQHDEVMRQRTALVQVGPAFPPDSVSLVLPSKSDMDMLRLKGRVVPKGGILPYFGAMTNFDATGLGIANTAHEGWAVCNGMNGTLDMRGMVPMGATNVPSSGAGSMYGGVEVPSDAGDAVGADGVQLQPNNLPPHKHPYVDRRQGYSGAGDTHASNGGGYAVFSTNEQSGDNVTTNDAISVRQASRALVFIQSII